MSERNHEVIKNQQLLDKQGNITEPGWSRRQLQQYSRAQIKAPKFRIKEWDYYLVVGDDCAVAFTLSDDGYVGLSRRKERVWMFQKAGSRRNFTQICWKRNMNGVR